MYENQRTMRYDSYAPSSKALRLIDLPSIPLQFAEVTHMYMHITLFTCTMYIRMCESCNARHLDSNTNFIQELRVEYHRVYQKTFISIL